MFRDVMVCALEEGFTLLQARKLVYLCITSLLCAIEVLESFVTNFLFKSGSMS